MTQRTVLAAMALLALTCGAGFGQTRPAREGRPDEGQIKAWIAQLGSENFDQREEAMQNLTKHPRLALQHLDKAAGSAEDREVRWNARLLARQLRGGGRRVAPDRSDDREHFAEAHRDMLEKLHEHLRELQEMQHELMEEFHASRGQLKEKARDLLKDRGFEGFGESAEEGLRWLKDGLQLFGDRESVMAKIEDGAVELTIKKNVGGDVIEETYAADSVEEFKEKYPEIAKRYGIESGDGFTIFKFDGSEGGRNPFMRRFTAPRRRGQDDDRAESTPAPAPRAAEVSAERLGVSVEDLSSESSRAHGFGGEGGMRVSEVQPGSLAEKLRVKPGDVLLTLNDQRLHDPEAVRRALKSVEPGGAIVLEVARGQGGPVRLETKKPDAKKKGERRLEKF